MAANPDTTESIELLMQKNVDNILQLYSKMKEEHEIHLNVKNGAHTEGSIARENALLLLKPIEVLSMVSRI